MSELRKDPVLGRWVIIATERGKRPTDFVNPPQIVHKGFCPFCEGNEDKTPPELIAYRDASTKPDTAGWWLRVVPNKFPALSVEGDLNRQGEGMYDMMNGVGAHEIIIESPDHDASFGKHGQRQVEEIIWAWRDRVLELRKDMRFRYIMIFKNHGQEAGASLDHPHSQLIAIPIVPKRVKEEMEGSRQYYNFKERCVYCDIVRQEISTGVRVVEENQSFIAFAPFASRFPFELWVVPKRHESHFENVQKFDVVELAKIMRRILGRMEGLLNDPPYNFIIHTSPLDEKEVPFYHWHIEIIPKLTKIAGFEWGTGIYINPTPPEDAARFLREEEPAEEVTTATAAG